MEIVFMFDDGTETISLQNFNGVISKNDIITFDENNTYIVKGVHHWISDNVIIKSCFVLNKID